MKKILVLLLLFAVAFAFCSCDDRDDTPPSPDIDACEWTLITGKAVGSSEYKNTYGVDDAPILKEDAILVKIKLIANEGALTLVDALSDKIIAIGDYSEGENGIYTVNLENLSFVATVKINEYVEWNSEVTGFDGNKYGKYSLDISSGLYDMLFISNENE